MPFCELPTGATLFYEEFGAGEPAVLVHGWLGSPHDDVAEVTAWLTDNGYHTLGPTRRGYGESLPKPRDYPVDYLERDARDMLALLDALAWPRAHLIGFSDGGEVALIMAGLAPERFKSCFVWGAVGYYGPDMRAAAQAVFPGDWMSDELKARNGITHADAYVLKWATAVKRIIDLGGDVSLSLAPKMTLPVLAMLGREDRLNPEAYAQRVVDAMPNGRLMMVDGGHMCHRNQPEAFFAALQAFHAAAREREE
jgi:valacyclovir hydrolase